MQTVRAVLRMLRLLKGKLEKAFGGVSGGRGRHDGIGDGGDA